ncbi:uncharacterized protein LOC110343901 isoform X2 [Heterocephalus glaber]|uniref:Uncharacterized protein LOC110343901 isoform X2 n=1 Tax=Heterocephalus glaber TaxID=10181 RepID=A0AAX6TH84_HETGA|nr:uncharacterized protein LOC110343901 isoform X2 [Heterocephalus glaber]
MGPCRSCPLCWPRRGPQGESYDPLDSWPQPGFSSVSARVQLGLQGTFKGSAPRPALVEVVAVAVAVAVCPPFRLSSPSLHQPGAHLLPVGLVPLVLLEGRDGADLRGAAAADCIGRTRETLKLCNGSSDL